MKLMIDWLSTFTLFSWKTYSNKPSVSFMKILCEFSKNMRSLACGWFLFVKRRWYIGKIMLIQFFF
jgi:hypothetical protein